MAAKASIPIRVEVAIYNLVEKTKQERDCTQVEAVNYLFSEIETIEALKKENENLKQEVKEWKKEAMENLKK